MFDRFTDRARQAMGYSRQAAQELSHDYIGTEHTLLGIVRQGGCVAADVLRNLGVDLKQIRTEVEKLVSPGTTMATRGQLPFTPAAKRVLELAYEEANNLGLNYIGSEHLLLGLIRERDGIAAQVLRKLKVRIEDVREEVLELLGADVGPADPPPAGTFGHLGLEDPGFPAGARAIVLAVLEELGFSRGDPPDPPSVILTFAPQAKPGWMFTLGALNARGTRIVLLLGPDDAPHPALAERATAVRLDAQLAGNLRAALRE